MTTYPTTTNQWATLKRVRVRSGFRVGLGLVSRNIPQFEPMAAGSLLSAANQDCPLRNPVASLQ